MNILSGGKYEKKNCIGNKTMQSDRIQFRTRFGLQRLAGKYSKDKSFARLNWMCKCLEYREVDNHLMSGECKVYGDLTLKYSDRADDKPCVLFYGDTSKEGHTGQE